jgi:hypothetical protein
MALCPIAQHFEVTSWPPSFKAHGVKSAYIGHDGLYLETDRVYVQEAGVFIPCAGEQFVPPEMEDPVYTQVGRGVFTYYVAG